MPPEKQSLITTDVSVEYFANYYALELTDQLFSRS